MRVWRWRQAAALPADNTLCIRCMVFSESATRESAVFFGHLLNQVLLFAPSPRASTSPDAPFASHRIVTSFFHPLASQRDNNASAFGTNRIFVRRRLSFGNGPLLCRIHVAHLNASHDFRLSRSICFNQLQQQPPSPALFVLPQLGELESSQACLVVVAPPPLPHHCHPLWASVYQLARNQSIVHI